MDLPERHHPAHPAPVHVHNRPVVLHVTVCVLNRRPLLASDEAHAGLREAWQQAAHWLVGYYLLMPDHIHLFCGPGVWAPPPVKVWARYWKRLAGQTCVVLREAWQPDCWDTQLRTQEHYVRKQEYVSLNPVRAGLVPDSAQWRYQGKVHDLPWISG